MGWTVTTRRRRDRLRHRPHLESLDDRCLLSTGLQGHPVVASASLRGAHPAGHVARHPGALGHLAPRHGHAAPGLERPAGTATPGASANPYDSIVGASQARSTYGVDGSGMTVAVIDTGVDYKNNDLGGGLGPGAKVIAGYNFATNTADPMPTGSQHGTGVAGLIASSGQGDQGVAPGAKIVALEVTDASGTATLDRIAQALQWVVDNHAQYNISVVNLSLSDGRNYVHNWFANGGGVTQEVTDLIGQLRRMNIPVVIATGNAFNGQQGEGFAAIVEGALSVTATDQHDHLLPDAQRLGSALGGASATTIAAPGDGSLMPTGDSGISSGEGTSFATPLVSGAVVLLQEIYKQRFGSLPTVDQIRGWLQGGADPIQDPVTHITIGRLDIPGAAALVPQPSGDAAPASKPASVPASTAAAPVSTGNPAAQMLNVDTATTPTPAQPTPAPAQPTPAPAQPTPAPAPAPVSSPPTPSVQVFSAAPAPGPVGSPSSDSGLATILLRSMRVWPASSLARG